MGDLTVRFITGFFGLVTLGIAVMAGIGALAERTPGADSQMVVVIMNLASCAAMLAATAIFVVDRVASMLDHGENQNEPNNAA
jgi:hypothetical protein